MQMRRTGAEWCTNSFETYFARRSPTRLGLIGSILRGPASASFLVRYVASTFILVLEWWLADVEPRSLQGADAVFRALVLPALAEFARS